MDSLVYSIYDQDAHKLLVLKSLSVSNGQKDGESITASLLEEILSKEDLLNPIFNQVRVALLEPVASLVPGRLFNEKETSIYLSELSSEPVKEEIQVDDVESLKIKTVYQIGNEISQVFNSKFPGCHFFHISTPFLLGCLQTASTSSTETAFACFESDSFQLALFNKSELLLYNN